MATIRGTFAIADWQEETLDETDGVRTTRVVGRQSFTGGIEGEGRVAWLLCYRSDGTARFVGLQRIEGLVDGRSGSIVLEASGDHDGTSSSGTWTVITGSGTGALDRALGTGGFRAPGGPTVDYELQLGEDG